MTSETTSTHQRWAQFRFAVVGPLLAAPPPLGQLQRALSELADKAWQHPMSGRAVYFGFSTIERWYQAAKAADQDPLGALRPRQRRDAGHSRQLSVALGQRVREQYAEHRDWTVQLHYDNLAVIVGDQPALGPLPSYATVRRYFRAQGLDKHRRRPAQPTAGWEATEQRLAHYEVRSYELAHVNALWHADGHEGSRSVVTETGQWIKPVLIGILDDYSRFGCHLQWHERESTHTFVHDLSQAIQKCGLPRALMTDRGGAMMAAEVREGLDRLGIVHQPTLSYSPHQNGKQETFWALIESRLLPMLDGVQPLTLSDLNRATHAWLYGDYHQRHHSELDTTPLKRYLNGPNVSRASPRSEALRQTLVRTQRRSDGTLSVGGRRFEIPSRFRSLRRIHVRFARWDLSGIDLIDSPTQQILCSAYPLDKTANASGQRRPFDTPDTPSRTPSEMAPLLQQLLADYAATGLPPAYIPLEPDDE